MGDGVSMETDVITEEDTSCWATCPSCTCVRRAVERPESVSGWVLGPHRYYSAARQAMVPCAGTGKAARIVAAETLAASDSASAYLRLADVAALGRNPG